MLAVVGGVGGRRALRKGFRVPLNLDFTPRVMMVALAGALSGSVNLGDLWGQLVSGVRTAAPIAL